MNSKCQALAKAFEAKLKTFVGTPSEFLESIPNSVNLKEDFEVVGVWSIQVMYSALNMIRVSTNGTQVLVEELT